MITAIEVPELIILLMILLLIFSQKLAALGRSAGGSIRHPALHTIAASPFFAGPVAIPDVRYARPPAAGAVAELFGIGWRGVRWRQVAVIVIGSWLSGNAPWFWPSGTLGGNAIADLIALTAWPIFFVFSAITGLRSFHSGPAVACSTAAMHSVLFTSLRFAIFDRALNAPAGSGYWIGSAAASFGSALLIMFAVQFAVGGRHIWRRMAAALFVTSLVGAYMTRGIYLGSWSAEYAVEMLALSYPSAAISAVMLTATFWLGSRVAQTDVGAWQTDGAVDADQPAAADGVEMIGLERFIPAAVALIASVVLVAGFDVPLARLWYEMTGISKMTAFLCPVAAATIVAFGHRSRKNRMAVALLALMSCNFPFLSYYLAVTGIALIGSAEIGPIAAGVLEALVGMPFVMSAAVSLALVTVTPQSPQMYRRTIVVVTAVVAAGIVVDLLALREFIGITATGTLPDEPGLAVRWVMFAISEHFQTIVLPIVYIWWSLLYVFPSLYLLKYANRIRKLVAQGQLNGLEIVTLAGMAVAPLVMVGAVLVVMLFAPTAPPPIPPAPLLGRSIPIPPPPSPPPPAGQGVRVGDQIKPAPPPRHAEQAVRVGGQIKPPIQTRRMKPEYPRLAQAARVQGVVILEVLIGTNGKVQNARVLRSIPLLDQAAIDAVMRWEFEPTFLNGRPVPVLMTVTVNFTL